MNLEWSDFKNVVNTRGLKVQELETPTHRHLYAEDRTFRIECVINKLNTADENDYVTNYQANADDNFTNSSGHIIHDLYQDANAYRGSPVYSSDLKTVFSTTSINLTTTFTTVYTRTGKGRFIGLFFDFNNRNTETRLTVDSKQVFSIPTNDLDDFQPFSRGDAQRILDVFKSHSSAAFEATFHQYPICYETDILLEVRATSGTRQLSNHMLLVTEE